MFELGFAGFAEMGLGLMSLGQRFYPLHCLLHWLLLRTQLRRSLILLLLAIWVLHFVCFMGDSDDGNDAPF